MIEIDPAVFDGWRDGERRNALCLEVDDPGRAWAALCDVLDELAAAPTVRGWSEVLAAPAGLLFCCLGDEPRPVLDELVRRLSERGVADGRVVLDAAADDAQPDRWLDLAASTSWVTAWLVPLMVPGVDYTYRTLREWRVRRFAPVVVDRVVRHLVAHGPAGHDEARVGWPGGALWVPVADLPAHARRWVEHGIVTTTSAIGEADPGAAVLVTSVRRGTELLGVGRAAAGLVDDEARATAALEELTELVVSLAEGLAYAVVGVHESGRLPATGTPFREVVPATARAQSRGLSLAALDQWVLDAGPVQLLNPHHQLAAADGVTEEPVAGGRRLVRVGTPGEWFGAGPAGRTLVRNRGRAALAACLPPPRTPMPAALL